MRSRWLVHPSALFKAGWPRTANAAEPGHRPCQSSVPSRWHEGEMQTALAAALEASAGEKLLM